MKLIKFCKDKMENAERNAERESITKIEEYKKAEKVEIVVLAWS